MKKQLMLTTVAMLVLFAMLLGLSCAPPAQNNANTARIDNAPSPANANIVTPEPLSDPCNATNDKPGKVKTEITNGILGKPKLKRQFEHKWFKLGVFPGPNPGALHVYFTGKLGDPDSMGDLAAIVKKVFKKSCVEKVFFATDGTISVSGTEAPMNTGAFFEWWIGCEDPNVPCTGGECKPPEQCPAPTPDPVVNTNTGMNMNMNTNTNSRPSGNGP